MKGVRKFSIFIYGLMIIFVVAITAMFVFSDNGVVNKSAIIATIASVGGSIIAYVVPLLFGFKRESDTPLQVIDCSGKSPAEIQGVVGTIQSPFKGKRKLFIGLLGMTIIFVVGEIGIFILGGDSGAIYATNGSLGGMLLAFSSSVAGGYNAEYPGKSKIMGKAITKP